MSDLSEGAARILLRARQLDLTAEGDLMDASAINPQFSKLRDANAAIEDLVARGFVIKHSHGALALTASGASEVLKQTSST